VKRQSLAELELWILGTYSKQAMFILEVGTGHSTNVLAKALREDGEMTTIDIQEDFSMEKNSRVTYLIGTSIKQSDMILMGDPRFFPSPYKNVPDESIAYGLSEIQEPCDLIRKACEGKKLDFYFGDSGEYCGLAEWNIVKDLIVVGGYIALHDIHYPKSSKNFQVYNEIRKSNNWHIHIKTGTIAGFVIAEKLK